MKLLGKLGLAALASVAISTTAMATPLPFWAANGWTQFADDDGFVGPGAGGQAFDTEYLYYQVQGNVLHIGLQTGFDVVDGHVPFGGGNYFAGDLALSFDGNAVVGDSSTYEYGIDFGLYTKGYSGVNTSVASTTGRIDMGSGTGIDPAGLYNSVTWNNDIYSGHHISDPFALGAGTFDRALLTNAAFQDGVHYVRTVSFDMSGLGDQVDVHWTMSCGNDNINGSFTVPEPAIAGLLGLGLLGLTAYRRRRPR